MQDLLLACTHPGWQAGRLKTAVCCVFSGGSLGVCWRPCDTVRPNGRCTNIMASFVCGCCAQTQCSCWGPKGRRQTELRPFAGALWSLYMTPKFNARMIFRSKVHIYSPRYSLLRVSLPTCGFHAQPLEHINSIDISSHREIWKERNTTKHCFDAKLNAG